MEKKDRNKLSIGKMAKLNQVTVQTLRYYDKFGLLIPALVDPDSGYRYYHIKQCARLDMIQYMKCLGMSLEKIKEYLDRGEIREIASMLKDHEQLICHKIDELRSMKEAAIRYRNNIIHYIEAPKVGEINLEFIEERAIFAFDTKVNFYGNDMDTWEYMIHGLKEQVAIAHLPMVRFCNVGSILRKQELLKGNFYSTEIFIMVEESEESTEILPAGQYLTIHFDDFYHEVDFANRLIDHAKEKGYDIIGDYICEVVAELPIFDEERKLYIKVQIPVKSP